MEILPPVVANWISSKQKSLVKAKGVGAKQQESSLARRELGESFIEAWIDLVFLSMLILIEFSISRGEEATFLANGLKDEVLLARSDTVPHFVSVGIDGESPNLARFIVVLVGSADRGIYYIIDPIAGKLGSSSSCRQTSIA